MENIIQLITEAKQKRAKVVEEQRGILAKAREEKRSFNADEDAAYNKAEADFKTFDEEVRRLESLKEREERLALEQHEQRGGKNTEEEEREAGSNAEKRYKKVVEKYFRQGINTLTPDEMRVLETRGTSPQSTTTTLGGYTIPQGFFPELIKSMVSYSGIMQAGRIIRTDSGNALPMPTVNDASTSASIVTEGTASTVADITFGQKTLNAYVLRTLAQASEELLMDSAFSFEEIITDLFADRLGRGANAYLTTGTDTTQPNGVVTASTAGKTAAGVSAFTRDEILDLIHSVDPAYRNGNSVGFMLHDSVLASIKKMTIGSGDDRPLWQMSVRDGEPDRLEGYRYWVNQGMASSIAASAKVLLFGDYSKYAIRIVRDVAVRRLNERYAESMLVGFLGYMRIDGELLDTVAVKHMVMAAS